METREKTLETIVSQWLGKQPEWYSYALHIALMGEFSEEDVNALAREVCKTHDIELDVVAKSEELKPFRTADLASAGIVHREITLEAIKAVSGVNAIAPGSELRLSPIGITVVYGNNGSGKSGFSRIIRNASTSRSGPETILSNVFDANGKTAVLIEATIDGSRRKLSWTEGDAEYPSLPEVAYFDSACALQELSGRDGEVLYAPPIISALERFARLITAVSVKIQQAANALVFEVSETSVPSELRRAPQITEVLSCNKQADAFKLVAKATLNEEESKRLQSLPQLIETDPTREIPKIERRLEQLKGMRKRLANLYLCTQAQYIDERTDATKKLAEAEEASKAASSLVKQDSCLEGVGSEAWKALWEAARYYSNAIAYPLTKYPEMPPGALCPLCHQPLGETAMHRLHSFETFVTGAAERNLKESQEALEGIRTRLSSAIAAVKGDESAVGILSETDARDAMDQLIKCLKDLADSPDDHTLSKVSDAVSRAGGYVRKEIDSLDKRLSIAKENLDPGKIAQLNVELIMLKARSWIAQNAIPLQTDAERRERKTALSEAVKECSSRSVSYLVSTVSKLEIVEKMQERFSSELARLKASNQRVSITSRVKSGRDYQQIALDGSKEKTRSVLSEGEQKIVALASFFALLDVMPGKSTAVLDDPVTSLDHQWREVVASRIIEETKTRPITVFTHDPFFCMLLSECADRTGAAIEYKTIDKRGSSSGIVGDGLEWGASKVKGRISTLRNDAAELRRKRKADAFESDTEFAWEITSCYSRLRAAWERAVEEVLLAGVISRAERPVHTNNLRHLNDITEEDISVVNDNMSKCSKVTEAHDDPLAAPSMLPTIEEFETDVETLATWVKRINKRRGS